MRQARAKNSLPVPIERFDTKRLFAFEVIVKRALGHAGCINNTLNASRVEALPMEGLDGGFDQLLFYARSGHLCSI